MLVVAQAPEFVAADLKVGKRCMAPIKRDAGRSLENVELVWVSRDGAVVEVQTYGTKARPRRETVARCLLKRLGTPAGRVVL